MANAKAYHAKEIIKCGRDPIYFFNKYVKIQHPTRGAIQFNTFDFQNDCVEDFIEHRFNIVLKARQLGLSTVTAAYALWMILFRENVNVLVIATKLSTAKNFIGKCKYMLKSLPPWLVLCEIDKLTVQEIGTSRGSTLKAVPTSEDAGRSEALSLLIVDEAAFVRDFDVLWKGLYPTLSTGGRAILLSTPNGTGNKFFEIYDQAEKGEGGKNKFHPIRLPWDVHPERDQEWFQVETGNMNKKDIAQELECDFAASGDTFIDAEILERLRLSVRPPLERVGLDRNVWIWDKPKQGHKYILAADTARGDGKDYSTFHIIDAEDGTQAVEYQGKMPPDRFADIINEFGLLYNSALVCPENNSVGYATIQRLCFLHYPKIYNNKEKTLDLWGGTANNGNLQKPSGDLGVFTSGGKRNVILTKLEEFLRNDGIKVYSSRLHKELKTFVWMTNNKVEAEKNRNDDLVIALGIGLWLLDTSDFTRYSDEHSRALVDSMTQSSSRLDDIIGDKKSRQQDDFSVLLPVAAGGAGFTMNRKTNRAQVINEKWNWLIR